MPRISIDNYDTVASWNGSQDLFVVEQPDGTKVATPAMVKQFIEAGDFEATGEVKDGHGNILKDMAKSADVDAEIGDLSETGITGDSVAEQLAGLNDAVGQRVKCGVVETPDQNIAANTHMNINYIPVTLPSTTIGCCIMDTPNSAWVFAYIRDFGPTYVSLGIYNSASSALTGKFKILYFYT